MTEFFVGQKVVCVDNSGHPGSEDVPDILAVGKVYTVAWVGQHEWIHIAGIGLRISGIERPGHNAPFGAQRFEPLQTKAISIFRRIARDVTEGKRVRIDA